VKKKEIVGVLTGDIINSSKLSNDQKAFVQSELFSYFENKTYVLLPVKFYRGDSFQLMVKKEKAALAALMIEAILLNISGKFARISIGVGSVSKLIKDNVLQSEGEAFLLSGHQLDKMKEEDRLIKIALNSAHFQPILSAAFYLAESIVKGWKPGQASVLAQIPASKTQKGIAEKLKISGAAVSKAIKTSNWPAIENFLERYEETLKIIYQ
jgi:hypothetical protein